MSKEFDSNGDFVRALKDTESKDRGAITGKMGSIAGLRNVSLLFD
jgi:hypothetical protein